MIGRSLADLFTEAGVKEIRRNIKHDFPAIIPFTPPGACTNGEFQAIVHSFGKELVIEIEERQKWPASGAYAACLNSFTEELAAAPSIDTLLQRFCSGIVKLFPYDRAIILRFDHRGDSTVTHEAKEEMMDSMLDVHFVKADVPLAARYDQVVGMVYSFANVHNELIGLEGSYGVGASEVLKRHVASRPPQPNMIQYLKDSELATTGYISLSVNDHPWGTAYMHAREPVYLDYRMRAFLRIAGRVCQQRVANLVHSRTQRLRQAANAVRDKLQEHIVTADHLTAGLTEGSVTLLDLIPHTTGAAICSDETLTLYQSTPSEEDVTRLMKWVEEQGRMDEVWHTDALVTVFPRAAPFQDVAAGVLFLPLDESANQWITWFRPEEPRAVTYGSQASENNERSSRRFEVYDTALRGHAKRWTNDDIGNALALQSFLKDVVMKRFAHSQRRNRLLQQAYDDLEIFSYTVGHDLRAPLRGITSFADILEEDFSEALGEEGLKYLRYIQDNAERMRVFMVDLLALNRIDRSNIIVNELSVGELAERALRDQATSEQQSFTFAVEAGLPPIIGDENHMQTLFTNLISNAIKYSEVKEHPHIRIGQSGTYNGYPLFFVEDNGIGIPASQIERVFELFNRGANVGNVAGTGIGLSLVKRIITLHEGEIWIESEEGSGTRFLFYSGMNVSRI
jgi:light-regulated signal transduction histidine kinase (bacteriophytochrome)